MALDERELQIAKEAASKLNTTLNDIPLYLRHTGIAIYVAADIASNASTKREAQKILKAFNEETRKSVDGMLFKLGKR